MAVARRPAGVIAGLLGTALLALGLMAPPAVAAPSATASLTASAARAPVGTEVPITLTVTPRSVADVSTPRGRIVRVQVRDQQGQWQTIDSYRLPRSGVLRTTVTGIVPGYTGQYRAVVQRLYSPRPLVTSNTVGIFWLNADGSEPEQPPGPPGQPGPSEPPGPSGPPTTPT